MGRFVLRNLAWWAAAAWMAACGGQSPADDSDAGSDAEAAQPIPDSSSESSTDGASDAVSERIDRNALGAACESDVDCRGMRCVRSTDDLGTKGAGGPAHGYCSVDCRAQTRGANPVDVCGQYDSFCLHFGAPGTIAPAWCMKTCSLGLVNKCQGRPDVACSVVSGATGQLPLCMPLCAVDGDCEGRRCDIVTGFCDESPSLPNPLYGSCVAGAPNTGCAALCLTLSDVSPGKTAPGVCTRTCVIGSLDGCGRSSGLPISSGLVGTCLADLKSGSGDEGECYQLCDTPADCRDKDPGTVCDPFYLPVLGHGICLPPPAQTADAGASEAGIADAAPPDGGAPAADALAPTDSASAPSDAALPPAE